MDSRSIPKISVNDLEKHFVKKGQDVHALNNINLEVRANEFLALVGASGCGKSTLLRIIGGLESFTEGEVLVDDKAVNSPGKDRVMVFQDYSLYPWLNVIENIRFCRQLDTHVRAATTAEAAAAVDRSYALLSLMGLEKVKNSYPNSLSGGMRQRVAIARALMSRPEVLLMDEPFGALDAQTREVMHDLILHVFELEKTTIVFVTHDVDEAIYLADRVVVLAPNPGHIDSIHEIDLPAPLERNQDLKLGAEFLQQKKVILDRIRETTGVQSDMDMLKRMTRRLRETPQH
ncbi:ABC transporter ATP-binding protein [Acidihalobacter prosperus]